MKGGISDGGACGGMKGGIKRRRTRHTLKGGISDGGACGGMKGGISDGGARSRTRRRRRTTRNRR